MEWSSSSAALQCSHPGPSLSNTFLPKAAAARMLLHWCNMTSLPSLFPSAKDGEGRWDVQRSWCKPALGRPLQRSVPKVLYFLPRAPDSTDPFATLGAEGRLPFSQPLITTSLQPAPPPLPHQGLQGLNPKQGEQGTGSGSPTCKPSSSPEGWDHPRWAGAISSARLWSTHLSPFP